MGRATLAAVALMVVTAARADAQPPTASKLANAPASTASGQPEPTSLRGLFGIEVAVRLAKSPDADDRLRGVQRMAATHTSEALDLLERAARVGAPQGSVEVHSPIDGIARKDPRALLVVVRGLAAWLDREPAKEALKAIVGDSNQLLMSGNASGAGGPGGDETVDPRVVLARQQAAIALAESGDFSAIEKLIAIARSPGPIHGPALDALAIHPPAQALLGGVVLTTPEMVTLAATVGDLRSIDAIEGSLSASDASLRAAALVSLGTVGDSRILAAARDALHDHDPRVRIAAGEALVRLAAPEGSQAVEGLIGDEATAVDGLRLAQLVQSDGVTRAAAARAVASSSLEVREAAVAALGKQTSALAMGALSTLSADPALQGDAMCALARSPSVAAAPALEKLAATPSMRRMAARAYFVRRLVRSQRSALLDDLLRAFSRSDHPLDRAIGVQALVALGEIPLERGLRDSDARVRRAAAMGALTHWNEATRWSLLARIATEPDQATRQVYAIGLLGGDPQGILSTADLRDRMRAGGADALLSALAVARRAQSTEEVEAELRGDDADLRAHVARGLGSGVAPDAVGYLAAAYQVEGDVEARRAIVGALAARTGSDDAASAREDTLRLAARLDPDTVTRWRASRALSSATDPARTPPADVAWLRLVPAPGAELPRDMTASLIEQDGPALPIAFDDDGYAIVPGVRAESARLRLAPRLPSYEARLP